MAALAASNLHISSSSSSSSSTTTTRCYQSRRRTQAALHFPKKPKTVEINLPKHSNKSLVEQLSTTITIKSDEDSPASPTTIAKLYALVEIVSDRIQMHKNIGEQRNNWNNLLLNSINAMTLTATTMTGLASIESFGTTPLSAIKLSSALLFSAATGMILIMNKIQPSQLAEEQRNAVRLFKQLHRDIQTKIAVGNFTKFYISEVVERVLALDKAFPLPLLGGVLTEKFPTVVEPSVWWPRQKQVCGKGASEKIERNGWNDSLEEEMREILNVLKRRDSKEYMRLGKSVLKVNKILAISGPLLTGIAAVGSSFIGSQPGIGAVSMVAGALASIVNTMEHGGQVGMVLEMYKNCGGFFQLLEETIESTLNEQDRWRRENGELFEMKVALQLGRSLEELRDLAAKSSSYGDETVDSLEFASKLF